MSGKRNVAVCRGHALANALYIPKFNVIDSICKKFPSTHGVFPAFEISNRVRLDWILLKWDLHNYTFDGPPRAWIIQKSLKF